MAATDIRMHDKNPRGLSVTYAADKQGKWAYFEPLFPIEGLSADNVGAKDPCDTAATVAGMMLQTMKGER